jgi:hypothetical protein
LQYQLRSKRGARVELLLDQRYLFQRCLRWRLLLRHLLWRQLHRLQLRQQLCLHQRLPLRYLLGLHRG